VPPVKVKLTAVVSANVANFQKVAVLPSVVALSCIEFHAGVTTGAVMVSILSNPTCAIIKLPTAKLAGLTITQVVLVAPGLTPYSI
jgi:hypothetical protein